MNRQSIVNALYHATGIAPSLGVLNSGIPAYQDVGNQCTEQFSAVIAGKSSIDSALENCQRIASRAER